ncbi:hypothetical protein L249_0632 [Ophiocordyceps polyrhachis-furcata BCC 54312]|uniref:Mtf2-like C-terminal domain-containing protein n=1 Tax=Ophiocordyceps polyrhachis-furcata BCC 54312 TaxID=1330021 RepID=A0A367LFW3_9HYPO|nr:hypothetical protein L249_0632 [Ophiocordyceps polyrhachis-furcata BCC 54312]
MLPFFHPARTRWREIASPAYVAFSRRAHTRGSDHGVPFDWGESNEMGDHGIANNEGSTITPAEAHIFKGIFEEIARGQMSPPRRRPMRSDDTEKKRARSIVDQARVTEFRDKFLCRYPAYLQTAARMALSMFETDKEGKPKMSQTDQTSEESTKYDAARAEERTRVEALMKASATDAALWKVLEDEVFCLPVKLGIHQHQKRQLAERRPKLQHLTAVLSQPKAEGSKPLAEQESQGEASKQATGIIRKTKTASGEKLSMDVYGPLYPHFLEQGLELFDTAFARPSPFALQMLPRIKALGLCSFVLGVSTQFYVRLARIHWNRYGDAGAALDVLQEMSDCGLYFDKGAKILLTHMSDNLHGCTWGAQGPFVMKMMEFSPFDNDLTRRLEKMEEDVNTALQLNVAQ